MKFTTPSQLPHWIGFDFGTFRLLLCHSKSLDLYFIVVLIVNFFFPMANIESLWIDCIHPTRSKTKERSNSNFHTEPPYFNAKKTYKINLQHLSKQSCCWVPTQTPIFLHFCYKLIKYHPHRPMHKFDKHYH